MPSISPKVTPYYGGGQVPNPANVIQTSGAPSNRFTEDNLGTLAVDNANANIYGLASKANGQDTWALLGGTNGFPITPFVVGPSGQAGYQTIQSAINAAHASAIATGNPQTVYVQPGTYTENLTLYDQVDQRAVPWVDAAYVVVNGQHTPPSSGLVQFEGFFFAHPTAIFNDLSANATNFNLINCLWNVTNGTSLNLPNYTSGTMNLYDCVFISGSDSIFNNSSGSMFFQAFDCALGVNTSTGNIQCNGNVLLDNSLIWPTFTMTSGTLIPANGCTFHNTVIFSGNSTGVIYNSQIVSGASAAINHGSSGTIKISDVTIDSSANPCIAGAGAGALTLGSVTFLNNSTTAGTLTLGYGVLKTGGVTFGGPELLSGSGAPAAITAPKGSLYTNITATTTTTRLYVNTDGGTTWANFTASA